MPTRPPTHLAPGTAAKPRDERSSSSSRGYDRDWRRLREFFLRRKPLCARCGRAASMVDHIVPLEDGGSRLDPANLQPLCMPCHTSKTRGDIRARKARRTGAGR